MKSMKVKLNNIHLDPNNFRLHGHPRYRETKPEDTKNSMVQKRTRSMICGDNREGIRDLIGSFKANGILKVDNILVKELDQGNFLVIEGNRRIAALKELLEDHEKGYDTGKLDQDFLTSKKVEVVLFKFDGNESESYLMLMGLRHVTGIKEWGDYEQSELVYELNTLYNLTFADIAEKLSIGVPTVKRRVNTFVALRLYKQDEDYGDFFSASISPIFYEVMSSPDLRSWLGWKEDSKEFENRDHLRRFFSWVSPGEDKKDPIIATREDVRTLKKLIGDPEALGILEESRSILEAYESSVTVTKEGVKKAIQTIAKSVGKIPFEALLKLDDDNKDKLKDIIKSLNAMEKVIG